VRRDETPRTELQRDPGWIRSLGRARSALATATSNLGEMVGSGREDVGGAVSRALDHIDAADDALVDALTYAGREGPEDDTI